MDSMQILIAALSVACLLVACLIVVVLRRPKAGRKRSEGVSDTEAQTLARIYAVHPASPAPSSLSTPAALSRPALVEDSAFQGRAPVNDAAPFGRMAGMPATPQGVDERERMLPGARMPVGPLPFERSSVESGWARGPMSPAGRPISGELAMPFSPVSERGGPSGALSMNTSGTLAGNRFGESNIGRMPAFAMAEQTSPAPPTTPVAPVALGRPADASEQRRLGALTRVYAEGIQVAYDAAAGAVGVAFGACPMRSPAEVELAFRVLLAKVRTVLKPLGRDRAALLVDVAGLEISPEMMPVWGRSLSEFLASTCEQPGPGHFLLARYNSRAPSVGNRQETIQRILSAPPAVAQGFQSSVLGSREEAAALLARLRVLAAIPGF